MNHNLKALRESKGLNRKELAKLAGVTASSITLIEAGKRFFSKNSVNKIAAALGCNEEDLFTKDAVIEKRDSRDLILVKKYDVFASAGDGIEVLSEEIEGEIALKRDFLKKICSADEKNLVFINVKGDSMYPTFKDGDMILIDKTRSDSSTGGIFVLKMGNVLKVKRIFFDHFAKKIRICSDNKVEINGERLYPDYEINLADAKEVNILGKVVWAGWSLK